MFDRTAFAKRIKTDGSSSLTKMVAPPPHVSAPSRRLGLLLAGLSLTLALAACGGSSAEEPAPGGNESAMEQPAAPAAGANNASITGTVTFNGVAPEMTVLDMAGDPECEELNQENPKRRQVLVLGDDQRIANVLVQIKGGLPAIEHAPATGVVEFDQGGCQYAPHVFALRVGQTLKILNSDRMWHNVRASAKVNRGFNVWMPSFRTEMEKVFDQAETTPFAVNCDVHPWMNAWAAVFDHPYFAVTGSDGAFTIGNLPAGTYELEIWHERLPPQTHTVTVAAGEQATVEAVMEAPSS